MDRSGPLKDKDGRWMDHAVLGDPKEFEEMMAEMHAAEQAAGEYLRSYTQNTPKWGNQNLRSDPQKKPCKLRERMLNWVSPQNMLWIGHYSIPC